MSQLIHMKIRRHLLVILVSAFAGLLAPTSAGARQYSIEAFELRGVVHLQDEWRFSIRNKATQGSFWLEIGVSAYGLTAESFDSESGRLTLVHQGSRHHLAMAKADLEAIQVVRSSTTNVMPEAASESGIPPAPAGKPPAPPNAGLPPKLPPPANRPEPLRVGR